jgi:protein-tyrosine phosphatase
VAEELSIVFVCTGNRFRSPLAESLLRRAAAAEDLPVRVRSRGTLELGRAPALAEAIDEASRLGLDLERHLAHSLAGESFADDDLVVGFERMHVVAAVRDAGALPERTFTLPELIGLLGSAAEPGAGEDPVARAREGIARAHAARPADPELVGVPELPDPLGRPRPFFRQTADRLDALVGRLARELFAP